MDVPSVDMFYNILKNQGKDEFDALANSLATNLNQAREKWENEQKIEIEKQRQLKERADKETKAALGITDHLDALFGDVWPRSASADLAKCLIQELNNLASKTDQLTDAVEALKKNSKVVKEKSTPDKTQRQYQVDTNSKEFKDLMDLIDSLF